MNLDAWIASNTADTNTTVEFGSMFFERLIQVRSKKKIGIEIHKPYIDNAKFHECQKIQGDFRKFETLVSPDDMDVALFVDTLEHITREDAFDLMSRVMSKFNKVLLMIPEGEHILNKDVFNMGADTHQTHRSTWFSDDVRALGFTNIQVDPMYHRGSPSPGCIFAVWLKPTY